MSWGTIVSALWLTLSLASCGGTPVPAASPSTPPGAAPEPLTQRAARARLRAVVRDQSFVEHLPESERATMISEPFSGRMVVLYLVDDRGAARAARASDLVDSGVTRDALRAVVEWNIANLLRDPPSCTSHAVTEAAHHGYYESSRLLLAKDWAALAEKTGKIVVAVPSNDTLFVACNPTPEVLQKLSVVVQNSYPQAARPVSPSLLTWSKDGWQELPARSAAP